MRSRPLLLVLGFLLGATLGWIPLRAQVNNPGLTFARLCCPPAGTALGANATRYTSLWLSGQDVGFGEIDGLLIDTILPDVTGSIYGIYVTADTQGTGATQNQVGQNVLSALANSQLPAGRTLAAQTALALNAFNPGAGTVTSQIGAYTAVSNSGGGHVTNGYVNYGVIYSTGASTTDQQYGYYLNGAEITTGVITTLNAFYASDLAAKATNAYYSWFDSRGVRRVREDATFDSVGQAIEALYNPQFTKYTAGATNFERGVDYWSGNVYTLTTEAGGTGTLRAMNLGATGVQVQINGKNLTLSGNLVTTGAFNPTFAIPSSSTWTFPSGGGTLSTTTGTVTSIATTSPITGGTITSTGTIACATCGVTGSPLSQFAATTSAQLAGVLSDETGSGVAMFATAPVITTNFTFVNGQGFYDDGANITGLRKTTGSNPQILNLYNTFTDAANYERLALKWASNIVTLGMEKAGTGTARAFNLVDSAGVVAIELRSSGQPLVFSGAASTAVANGLAAVTIHNGAAFRNTTGTAESVLVNPLVNPSTTSTYVYQGVYVNPTINYSAVTPGAGSYEALKLAVVETALPTGTNYLIRASAGAAGTTDKFTVTNAGNVANAGTLISTGAVTHSSTTLLSGDVTFSDAINLITNATTGPKFGTATSQKLAFWNATPIIQPVNSTAIDTLLTNTGLRASGGTANFATLVSGTYLQGTTVYSAAGTALPTCNGAAEGARAAVSDALTPTFLTAYVSGGTTHASVYCNGTAWLTD